MSEQVTNYHPELLFEHNPHYRELTVPLFYNRVTELKGAINLLSTTRFAGTIYAIHGFSRTGKSHFAKRLLLADQIRNNFNSTEINVNSIGSCRGVLESVFFELKRLIDLVENPVDVQGSDTRKFLQNWSHFFNTIAPLIDGSRQQQQLSLAKQVRKHLATKIGASLAGLTLDFTEQTTFKEDIQAIPPHNRLLVQYLWEQVDVLWNVTGKPTIIYFDDLDLLSKRDKKHQEESESLLQMLAILAQCEHVVVLASIRTLYFNVRSKTYKELARIRAVKGDFLSKVYELHINQLNRGETVFSPQCLKLVKEMSLGRIGVFLRLCGKFWRKFWDAPISTDHLTRFLEEEIQDCLDSNETRLTMVKVFDYIKQDQMTGLDIEADVIDGPFAFWLLRRNPFGTGIDVVPHTSRVIKKLIKGSESE